MERPAYLAEIVTAKDTHNKEVKTANIVRPTAGRKVFIIAANIQ